MFKKEFAHFALSVVGAFIFTATAVGAAVGPARLVETSPVVYAGAASDAAVVA